eukprot:1185527-Rhodomonas_salina.2
MAIWLTQQIQRPGGFALKRVLFSAFPGKIDAFQIPMQPTTRSKKKSTGRQQVCSSCEIAVTKVAREGPE